MKRVQVNLSDELLKKVDYYAEYLSVPRSTLCTMFIGQGVMGYDKGLDIIDSLADSMKDIAREEGKRN
ncbi:hypothetical protein SAMN04487831_1273 [Pseudobutyrivibrio sp. UC1225]|uniref:hypothetical protein n=1 Tax=Pseudobutyrivibrio sp. UC1225 TaxID=1798185 RepID=UPI0008F2C460|nr:hypothetical protein [Pseudobutyrivibrio sp. UC1225]SFO36096.1 hypothetical protein SAMN04487831_1273 [Pseudobutyrivibrio sp. UC1225]